MRRILTLPILAAVLFVYAGSVKAQTNVVKVNIVSPIVRTATLFYEHQLTENRSLQLGVFYTFAKVKTTDYRGFGITPEYRFYRSASEEALQGFYIAPYLRYVQLTLTCPHYDYTYDNSGRVLSETERDASADLTTYGGGVMIGRQTRLKGRFLIDPFIGLGFNLPSFKVGENGKEENFNTANFMAPYQLRAGIALGMSF